MALPSRQLLCVRNLSFLDLSFQLPYRATQEIYPVAVAANVTNLEAPCRRESTATLKCVAGNLAVFFNFSYSEFFHFSTPSQNGRRLFAVRNLRERLRVQWVYSPPRQLEDSKSIGNLAVKLTYG